MKKCLVYLLFFAFTVHLNGMEGFHVTVSSPREKINALLAGTFREGLLDAVLLAGVLRNGWLCPQHTTNRNCVECRAIVSSIKQHASIVEEELRSVRSQCLKQGSVVNNVSSVLPRKLPLDEFETQWDEFVNSQELCALLESAQQQLTSSLK